MYNAGGIVVIKSEEWFSHQCNCGKAYFDAQPFALHMYKYCGRRFKIERVSEPIGYPPVYFLNTETTDAFTAPMFELVIQFPIIE